MNSIMNYENDLAQFLEEQEQADCGITLNTNEITDRESANYYIRKVKELQFELQNIEDTAAAELKKQAERIHQWRENASSQYTFLIDKYIAMLRDFWVKAGDNKTMKLSHGSLCMRKMRSKTEFDEESVLQFLQDHNLVEYIDMKPSINKSNLKDKMTINEYGDAYIDFNGSTVKIDGIHVTEQAPKFEVK